jgi:hypothetical protein
MGLDDYTPEQAQSELLELVIKAGRRCAYDLDHAAVSCTIGDRASGPLFHKRAEMWLGVFNGAKGPKDYQSALHTQIMRMEARIAYLTDLCRQHGVDTDKLMPF